HVLARGKLHIANLCYHPCLQGKRQHSRYFSPGSDQLVPTRPVPFSRNIPLLINKYRITSSKHNSSLLPPSFASRPNSDQLYTRKIAIYSGRHTPRLFLPNPRSGMPRIHRSTLPDANPALHITSRSFHNLSDFSRSTCG